MTRVAVIGNAGGGKSTLCRTLSRARQLPLFPIDQIQ
jgi:adenylate kinase family enzyme